MASSPRGPRRGTLHRLPTVGRPSGRPVEMVEARKAPPVPRSLGSAGRKAWRAVFALAPLLLPDLDAVTITRFCSLVDERELVRAEMARGVLLDEPLISPKGEIVGSKVVPNPAFGLLRSIDKQLDALVDRLGLVPSARARLGLTMTTAERQAVEVDRILGSKWRTPDDAA